MRWDLQPDDHVFTAGHRIGLVVVSTDHDYTIRPKPGTELTLAPRPARSACLSWGASGGARLLGRRVDVVDPVHFLGLLDGGHVEVDDHRLLAAAHQHA